MTTSSQLHANFSDGTWIPAAEAVPNTNPSNTADIVGEYARAGADAVDSTVAAA